MLWKNTLGSYSVYPAPNALITEKLIQDAHALTLHGVVGLTMTYIRCDYWMPRLRPLTKKVNHSVLDVKGFRLQPFKTHHQEICPLNAPPVQFLSKSWVWTMPVQFQTRPVPREKPEKPTGISCCLQRCLSRVSSGWWQKFHDRCEMVTRYYDGWEDAWLPIQKSYHLAV